MKELYKKPKETIERFFETAKEYHNLRYSREKEKFIQNGRKVWACFGVFESQKTSKNEGGQAFLFCSNDYYSIKGWNFSLIKRKRQTPFGMFVFGLNNANILFALFL